jgi:amidohydrolase
MSIEEMKSRAQDIVDDHRDRLLEISHKIHEYAELGYEEFKSSKLLAEELMAYGFGLDKPVAGLKTAFKATFDTGKRGTHIGYLGEYDALPDMTPDGKPGHVCGHNLIGTAALGAGYTLSKIMKEYDLGGAVSVFGCPCEEGFKKGAGGKIPMIHTGVFNGVDISMMVHPGFGRYGVYGKARAKENMVTRFEGRRATSDTRNYDVVNALDAAISMINGIYILKQSMRPEAVITYIINKGGVNPNIIPLEAEVRTYIRSLDYEYLTELVSKIRKVAEGAANMVGAGVELKKHAPTYAASIPNMTLVDRFYENLKNLGVRVEDPSESAKRILDGERVYSTDYGWVSREIPSGTIFISLGPSETTLHTREAVELTKSSRADEALLIGIKALTLTGIDFLTSRELFENARSELEGYKANNYRHPYPK